MRKSRLLHFLVFMLPALALVFVFVIYPSARTIILSFFDEEGHFTLQNYKKVLSSRDTINIDGIARGEFPLGTLLHNAIWIAIHLPFTTFLGLILAVLLRRTRGGNVLKSFIFFGMVMPMIVGGVMINFLFDANVGIVNALLKFFGVHPRTWTAHPETALFSLILGSVWLWTGFGMTLYSAGLETIPKDFYEAASLDGAGPITQFFKITIPLLKPITVVVMTMTLLWDLKIFDIVYVATQGGPGGASNVLAIQMYNYAFVEFDYGKAAVVAVLLTIFTMIAAIPLIRTVGEES